MSEPIAIRTIRVRRDSSVNWSNKNPVLKLGEPGLETDTRKLKFGDGVASWNNLPYIAAGSDTDSPIFLETLDDRVASLIKAGDNIQVSYNDDTNELIISASSVSKIDLGLENVDNTSDVNKPVSTAQAAADIAVQNAASTDATTKANNAQAFAIQRNNHTGTQAISTVDGLQTALNLKDWTAPTLSSASAFQAESKRQYYLPPTTAGVQPLEGPTPITIEDPLVGNVGDYYLVWNASRSPIVLGGVSISPIEGSNDNIYSRVFVKGSTGLLGIVIPDRWETRNHNNLGRKIQKIRLGFNVPSPITAEINTEYVFAEVNLVGPYVKGNLIINDPVSASDGDGYVVHKPSYTMHNIVVGGVTYSSSSPLYIYRHCTLVGLTLEWKTAFFSPVQSVAGKTGAVTLTKDDVGLGNVDNTSDANKPVSSATQTALNEKANVTNAVIELGTVSGNTAINYDPNTRSIQTLTLNGTSTTLTKGSGWPTSSNISVDVILKITVSSATNITWSIVNEWYNQPVSGPLGVGTHLFLLRAVGTTIEGHYIGNRTN